MLDKRHSELLAGLIEHYIATARPVSSAELVKKLKLRMSSATARNALQELEKTGFVQQPHTSAGRIPTDQGYRYYVDHLRDNRIARNDHNTIAQQYQQLLDKYQHISRSTAKLLSLLSHSVVMTGIPEAKEMQLAGLQELLKQPEGESPEAIREVTDIVEALDEYLDQFTDNTKRGPQVFIGDEIPFIGAKHSSIVLQGAHPEENQNMMLVIIGPKRMPYQRNVQLLNAVSEIIDEQSYD